MNLDHLKDMNLLYVEDDENIANPTLALLEKIFHKIYHRDNAEDGLEVIKNEAVDILITDIELPGMSGLTFCEEIRKIENNLPIFITTIHDDYNTLKKAIKLNLVDFLVKPISVSTIMNTLSESLDRISDNNGFKTKIGDSIDFYPSSGELIVSDKKVNLTMYELKLLTFLAKHKNNLVTRDMIEDVLDYEDPITDAAYKNLIYRLRKKIGKNSLHTVVGVGIKLKV